MFGELLFPVAVSLSLLFSLSRFFSLSLSPCLSLYACPGRGALRNTIFQDKPKFAIAGRRPEVESARSSGGGQGGGQSLPLAAPEARNFENFGRNSRYLRIPGNRLCPRAKRGRPASAATPKAQITDFAEVSPGFYYRPQRIMDSVPFCGFACPTLHPRKLCVFSFFLEFTKTLLLYVRIQYCADMSSVTQLQYCLHQLLLTT